MLASPYRCTDCSTHAFMPPVSSPLRPRSANIYGRSPIACMSQDNLDSAAIAQKEQQKCGKIDWKERGRETKKAKGLGREELKEKRRGMFLRKVREGREDRRFEQRGEDIMRLDFVQRQREWEAEQASQAPALPSDPIEEEAEDDDGEDTGLPQSSGNAMQMSTLPLSQQEEADEVLRREQEEMEALLAFMPDNDQQSSQNLWSDDDDYDALFSEVMDQSEYHGAEQVPSPQSATAHMMTGNEDEDMDLS